MRMKINKFSLKHLNLNKIKKKFKIDYFQTAFIIKKFKITIGHFHSIQEKCTTRR